MNWRKNEIHKRGPREAFRARFARDHVPACALGLDRLEHAAVEVDVSDVKFFTASDFETGELFQRNAIITPAWAAQVANRLLSERAQRWYGTPLETGGYAITPSQHEEDTHALLIHAVEPIVRDTPEGLLRLLVEHHDAPAERESLGQYGRLIDRARRVLEGGAK